LSPLTKLVRSSSLGILIWATLMERRPHWGGERDGIMANKLKLNEIQFGLLHEKKTNLGLNKSEDNFGILVFGNAEDFAFNFGKSSIVENLFIVSRENSN
jgi:hypothetical protein